MQLSRRQHWCQTLLACLALTVLTTYLLQSRRIIDTTFVTMLTCASTPKYYRPATDTRVLTEDDLKDAVRWRLRSLPIAYCQVDKKYGMNFFTNYNETCAPFPSIDDIVFDNTYWQTLRTSNGTFYLYGAYMDVRNTSFLGPTVRILGVHDRINPNLTTHCQLWFEDRKKPVIVRNYEYLYIWLKQWGNHKNDVLQPYLMSCVLPKKLHHLVPVSVSLVENSCDRATNNLRVRYDRPSSKVKKFAVCVKGLDFMHEDLSIRLVEWIEFVRLMGADMIFFYELQVHPNITKVLDYYSALGVVTVTPITLPGGQPNLPGLQHIYLKRKLIHKRQMEIIPYNDCLYRNLYEYRWVVLLDIDEIIVPVMDDNWGALMQRAQRLSELDVNSLGLSRASYFVYHTYFLDAFRNSWQVDVPRYMHMLQHVLRTHNYTEPGFFVKAFHETDRVLTLHNHFPVACLGGGICSFYWMETNHARLHHYRKNCVPDIQETCNLLRENVVRSTLVWRWREPLVAHSNEALRSLGFLR